MSRISITSPEKVLNKRFSSDDNRSISEKAKPSARVGRKAMGLDGIPARYELVESFGACNLNCSLQRVMLKIGVATEDATLQEAVAKALSPSVPV